MLYLAIDLHKNQITVNLRNEEGSVLLKKQISTNHTKIDEFFKSLDETSAPVCGLWQFMTLEAVKRGRE